MIGPSIGMMVHCRVTGASASGVPDVIPTVIVTMAGFKGAVNRALRFGGVDKILPSEAVQWMAALGGTTPSSVNGICLPMVNVHCSGKIRTWFCGVDGELQAVRLKTIPSDIKVAKIMLRFMAVPILFAQFESEWKKLNFDYKNPV